jgi:hypothetical protein
MTAENGQHRGAGGAQCKNPLFSLPDIRWFVHDAVHGVVVGHAAVDDHVRGVDAVPRAYPRVRHGEVSDSELAEADGSAGALDI